MWAKLVIIVNFQLCIKLVTYNMKEKLNSRLAEYESSARVTLPVCYRHIQSPLIPI